MSYCDECGHDYQPIHKRIRREFQRFIKANRKWINKIQDGEVIRMPGGADHVRNRTFKLIPGSKIRYTIYNNNLLDDPYSVRYVSVISWGEGNLIVFLDAELDKIFEYYDVM